jgi:hypothetical protein
MKALDKEYPVGVSLMTRRWGKENHEGSPFTPAAGVDNSLTGVGHDRPNVVGDPYVRDRHTLVWINPASFVANALGTFGNAGYNSLIGPGFFNLDANLTRSFAIREHQRFDLRFEFFNLLNHTNFSLPREHEKFVDIR